MTLTIGLVNDIHLGFPGNDTVDEVLDQLIDAVQQLNDSDVDAVIGLGDFIEHSDRETDVERLEMLASVFSRIDTPFYAIPGNHDVVNMQAGEVLDRLDASNQGTYDSVEHRDRTLIFLDTTHRNPDLHPIAGFLGSEQREWLEDRLETASDALLFSHHLLHFRQLEGNFYFDDKPELAIAVDKRHITKMIDGSVSAVFSAHIHETGIEQFHGTPHITLGGMDKREDRAYTAAPGTATIDQDRLALIRNGKRYDARL